MKDLKVKADKEKVLAQKRHKAEVKSWKKDLGEERKKKINLEKKLEIIMNKEEVQKMQKKKEKCILYVKIVKTLLKPRRLDQSTQFVNMNTSAYYGSLSRLHLHPRLLLCTRYQNTIST